MLFQKKHILAAAAALFSLTGFASANDCDAGPFDKPKTIGKPEDGGAFCDTKWTAGHVMTGIEVWATKFQIHAIQFAWSDGTKSGIHGNANIDGTPYDHGSITWAPGDLVTEMRMEVNHYSHGDALGMLHVEIAGQTLHVSSNKIGKDDGDVILLSSGLIVGAYGSTGDFVDSMGFMFLKQTVGKAQVVEIQFPETLEAINKENKGVSTINLDSVTFKNPNAANSTLNQTYSFSNAEKKAVTKTTTQQYTHTFGIEVGVEVGGGVSVPLFAEATAKITTKTSYQYATMSSTSGADTNDHTLTWNQAGTIAPQMAVRCNATAQTGHYASDYTSVVEITLADNTKFKVNMPGHFDSVGYSDAVSQCENIPISEAGSDAIEGTPIKSSRLTRFKARESWETSS